MNDGTIMAFLGFIVAIITIVTPLLKLNATIAKLTVSVEHLEKNLSKRLDDAESEIDEHGEQIHALEVISTNHDVRLSSLEKRK